ncbi:MAG: S8 family serine peptidase [Acidobacteria bacterium]|nr:S8 family serine peptidase [Acidobacteriota bacterium]
MQASSWQYAEDPDGNPNTDDGADVISMSLSTFNRSRLMQETEAEVCDDTTIVPAPGPLPLNSGAVIVAAAGNQGGKTTQTQLMYPAAERIEGLLSVGASTTTDTLADFSTRGSWVRVLAPGDGITSSVPGGGYGAWRGTSMAAPLVAGEAALLRSAFPDLSPLQISDRIRETSDRPVELKDQTVSRRVNPAAALLSAPLGTVNPIIDSKNFVRQNYLDFFNRAPDESGFNFWTTSIDNCPAGDTGCLEVKRIDTSAAFFLSIEFQGTGYLVYRMHKASFGDMPRYEKFMPDTQSIGQGVVVNAPGWEAKLEDSKRAFANEWVKRAEFKSAFPDGMTPAAFVDKLFANAGVIPFQVVRDALVAELAANNTPSGRAGVLRKVADSPEIVGGEFKRAFVLMQYFGYLRRNPNDAPEPTLDFAGYNFWLKKLEDNGGDFHRAEMVKAFITSGEYRERFGPQ